MNTNPNAKILRQLKKMSGRNVTLGGMLESIRLGEEDSQTAFAKKLGISPSHLCDIEKGRKSVSATRAASFARVLGYSESQFIRFAIQDELNRSGLKFKVSVEKAS